MPWGNHHNTCYILSQTICLCTADNSDRKSQLHSLGDIIRVTLVQGLLEKGNSTPCLRYSAMMHEFWVPWIILQCYSMAQYGCSINCKSLLWATHYLWISSDWSVTFAVDAWSQRICYLDAINFVLSSESSMRVMSSVQPMLLQSWLPATFII